MFNNLREKFNTFNIFEDIMKDPPEEDKYSEITEDPTRDQSKLFKTPKYLERVIIHFN